MQKQSIYEKITSKYQKTIIKSLKEFVAKKSPYDEVTVSETDPFGKGVSDALIYFENLAKGDGFKVTNYDNKIVEAILGEGEKNITIMAHADVVPEGTGWEGDPYTVLEKGNTLIGRGVSDDKGPCLAAYYAALALRDNGLLGNYQVRILVGGNEESGSECMEHYFHTLKKPQPTLGFSPDADFPLIYAEKAIFGFVVSKKHKIPNVISIEGGEAPNAVIERCEVKFELTDDIVPFLVKKFPDANIVTKDDVVTVTFVGVGAHGSTPQLGKNAGMMALKCIYAYTKDEVINSIIDRYSDLYGKGINAYCYSKDMGKSSCNMGILSYKEGAINFIINFRYGDGVDHEELCKRIKEANEGFNVKFSGVSKLLYNSKDSPLIQTLLHSYQEETGDYETQPMAIGGGTYSKEADNVVAFGMEFPGHDSRMHTTGECIEKDHLFKAMAIYARAIVELGKLIDENKI